MFECNNLYPSPTTVGDHKHVDVVLNSSTRMGGDKEKIKIRWRIGWASEDLMALIKELHRCSELYKSTRLTWRKGWGSYRDKERREEEKEKEVAEKKWRKGRSPLIRDPSSMTLANPIEVPIVNCCSIARKNHHCSLAAFEICCILPTSLPWMAKPYPCLVGTRSIARVLSLLSIADEAAHLFYLPKSGVED